MSRIVRARTAVAASTVVALGAVLLGGGAVTAATPPSSVVNVQESSLGTTNFVGDWGPTAPNNGGWDILNPTGATNPAGGNYTVPFSALPAAGSTWVLDIEGKAAGTGSVEAIKDDLNALVMTTEYPAGGAWPEAQKLRYQYFFGTGGYPSIEPTDGTVTVADLFASEFSYVQDFIPGVNPGGNGETGLEFRMESSTGQRVSVFTSDTKLTAPDATVVSDPSFTWQRNSSVANWHWSNGTTYNDGYWINDPSGYVYQTQQQAPETVTELVDRFGDWKVVSFGPNLGRGADGTATIYELTVLGTKFVFDQLPDFDPDPETNLSPADELGTASTEVTTTGDTYTYEIGTDFAGSYVGLYVNSTPVFAGWFLVAANGTVTFTVPASVPHGVHSLVFYTSTGGYIGYLSGFNWRVLAATGLPLATTILLGSGSALLAIGGVALLGYSGRRRYNAQRVIG